LIAKDRPPTRDQLLEHLLATIACRAAVKAGDRLTPEEIKRRTAEARERALASFPFELVETSGEQALATWQSLKTAGRGVPVVLGGEDSLVRLSDALSAGWGGQQSAAAILSAADRLRYPDDFMAHRAQDAANAREALRAIFDEASDDALPKMSETDADGNRRELTREEVIARVVEEEDESAWSPPLGEWPSETGPSPGLSVIFDYVASKVFDRVFIALIPTNDWTTVPAHLCWGAWNECPPPEFHVAALRSWRDRYGAELVGLNGDTMNLMVKRRPQTREEALALAREQCAYCADIVDQGVETLSNLAATLMADDWWFFWWD